MGPAASRPSARAAGSGSSSARGTRPGQLEEAAGDLGAQAGHVGGVAGEVDLPVGEGEQRGVRVAHLDVGDVHGAVRARARPRAGELDVAGGAAADGEALAGGQPREVEVEADHALDRRRAGRGRRTRRRDSVTPSPAISSPSSESRRAWYDGGEGAHRARGEAAAHDVEGVEARVHDDGVGVREGDGQLDRARGRARDGVRRRAERGQPLQAASGRGAAWPERAAVEGARAAGVQLGDGEGHAARARGADARGRSRDRCAPPFQVRSATSRSAVPVRRSSGPEASRRKLTQAAGGVVQAAQVDRAPVDGEAPRHRAPQVAAGVERAAEGAGGEGERGRAARVAEAAGDGHALRAGVGGEDGVALVGARHRGRQRALRPSRGRRDGCRRCAASPPPAPPASRVSA